MAVDPEQPAPGAAPPSDEDAPGSSEPSAAHTPVGSAATTVPGAWAGEPIARVGAPARDAVTLEQPGRYLLKGEHGRGGQSRVLLAVDRHMGREIAIKELLPALSARAGRSDETPESASALARFLREARICAQLEHPNIVPVYELGRRADGTYYTSQKLVRGQTLRAALDGCRTLAQRLGLLPHLADVCNAVGYAHSRGVIHRDLKPENVMVGQFGETVLLDWGLAKGRGDLEVGVPEAEATSSDPAGAGVTIAGRALGTPAYMSPEQAMGKIAEIDERSDVWSLGAMLYELLAGRPPFAGKTAREVLGQARFGKVEPVRALEPRAPADLCAVAERALQRDSVRRYRDAGAMAAEIAAWRAGRRVAAYDYSSWELLARFAARNRVLTALVALLVIGLTAGGVETQRRYRAAREQLAQTLVAAARAAEREQGWARASALYAAARVQQDRADARFGLSAARQRAAVPLLRLAHPSEVPAVDLSPDGQLLAAPSGREIHLWEARTGEARGTLSGHRGKVWRASFAPPGTPLPEGAPPGARLLASAAEDGTVRLWDAASGRELRSLAGPARDVRNLLFSPDGRLLASLGYDRSLTVRETATGEPLPVQLAAKVWGAAFAPDSRTLAAGALDGAVLLLDARTARVERRLLGHAGAVLSAAFSPDGTLLATAALDGAVRLWEVKSGETLARLTGFNSANAPAHVSFSPDGRALAYTARGNAAVVIDTARFVQIARLEGHGIYLLGLAFAPDGKLACAARDGVVHLWDVAPAIGAQDRLDAPGGIDCAALAFTRDGRTLASGCAGKAALLWDLAGGKVRARLEHAAPPVALAFSPDESLLATGGLEGGVHLWEAATGRDLGELGRHASGLSAVAFLPSGALATAARDGELALWAPAARTRLQTLRATARVNGAAVDPQGTLLAAATDDGTVQLWDLPSGAPRPPLAAHRRRATNVAFSPDGATLVSISSDATAALWDPRSGRLLGRLDAGSGAISVAVSAGGNLLATGGESLKLWSLPGLELLLQREGEEPAAAVAFPPGGRAVLVGGFGGTLRFHRWDDPDALAPPERSLGEVLARYRLKLSGASVEAE